MKFTSALASGLLWASCALPAQAIIELDLTSSESIKAAAGTVAFDMMSMYSGNLSGGIPGQWPYPPYYWWESGAAWGSMINYWYYTKDPTYNEVVKDGILWQVGADRDFNPANQSFDMGNDDQAFWAITALMAAETNFINPVEPEPQYMALAQAVFNEQTYRIDPNCGGGLRWQVFPSSGGYTYKNTVSNMAYFHMGARLARYTNNMTYMTYAVQAWDWMDQVGLIGSEYELYDGTYITDNCSSIDALRWSYNNALALLGSAVLYNITNGSTIWKERTQGILNAASYFFNNDSVMIEMNCEDINNCNPDEYSFKAYMARFMAATAVLADFTYDTIKGYLQASAAAAAQQCNGGANGRLCGYKWHDGSVWDGTTGLGQQMSALEMIQVNLMFLNITQNLQIPPLVTNSTGGTSGGNAGAGTTGEPTAVIHNIIIGTKDRVGAGIITAMFACGMMGMSYFLIA